MTTYLKLEDIILSEISQEHKDKYSISHLYVESKTVELIDAESGMMVTRDWGPGGRNEELLVIV